VFALLFALPASEHVARELVAVACEVAGDGCDDGCDDGAGVCLDGCGHCACCQAPMVSFLGAPMPWLASGQEQLATSVTSDDPPLGVVASPFRPPTA